MPRSLFSFPLAAFCLTWLLVALPPAQAQVQRLPALQADSSFGTAVALSGSGRAVVGASGEDVCGPNSGAVYVFEKDGGGAWEQAARLVASDCEAGAFFGRSLALSGGRVLVGASKEYFADERPNVAYVFERDAGTGTWREAARLTVPAAADPSERAGTFAASVALDGDRALVTARGRLARPGEEPPNEPNDGAAAGQGVTRRGEQPASGGTGEGAAYVFERRAGRWERVARLAPHRPDARRAFGGAGALSGDRLVVTASPYFSDVPGAVYVFERTGASGDPGGVQGRGPGGWVQAARIEGFDDFSVPVALDGERLLVGESRAGSDGSGAAVLFERSPAGAWRRRARLRPRTPYRGGAFGTAVSLSGDHALVTGYDEQLGLDFNIDRVAYVFERSGEGDGVRWRLRQILDMGDVAFGAAVDHRGREALVGFVPEDGPGAAYVIGLR